jgi:hypothetical protein
MLQREKKLFVTTGQTAMAFAITKSVRFSTFASVSQTILLATAKEESLSAAL